jgi:lipopolysaccharide transport system ATP-binding protein
VGTGFHPELTGRENIFLNGSILGMRKHEIARKLDEIIEFSGVERYIDTPVKRYSSGMYVRLAFAVAAHLESEILIVDEVLAVGDAEFQKKCLGRMKDVSVNEGRTVLFVSHNMAAVRRLCSRALLIDRGGVSALGNTSKTIDFYMTILQDSKLPYFKGELRDSAMVYEVFLTNHNAKKVDGINSFDGLYYLNVIIQTAGFTGLKFGCTIFNQENEALISSEVLELDSNSVSQNYQAKIEIPHEIIPAGNYYLEGALWSDSLGVLDKNDFYISIYIAPRNKIELEGGGVLGKILNPNSWVKS